MRWLALIACLCCTTAAFAHSGHSHGPEAPGAPAEAEPRFSAGTAGITLVGILKGQRLWLYADDPASNAPLDGLSIEVDADGRIARAEPAGAGAYSLSSADLLAPGEHTLVVTALGATVSELVTASLHVPATADTRPEPAPMAWNIALPVLLSGCVLVYAAWKQSRRSPVRYPLAVILGSVGLSGVALSTAYLLYASTSIAAIAPAAVDGAAADDGAQRPDTRPRRLPDGAAFIPKPAQTLLELRTTTAQPQHLPNTLTLPGRIIDDPQSTVLVQAEQTGRLAAPEHGFPQPGTRVAKGELLAHLHPVVSSLDAARQRAELAGLEKDLYLSKRQTERVLAQLGTHDPSASVTLEVSRAEQEALRRRIDLLRAALTAKIPLTAPADGVIGESNAVNGAVIPAGGQVFSIVDPTRFWMQALAAPDMDTARISSAQAVLRDGSSFPLAFAGHGYRLDNQALPLQFRPLAVMPALVVGTLLDIRLQSRETVEGIPVPKTAVQPAAGDGGALVWVRADAERFEARRVSVQALDDASVLVVSGLQAGERVVDSGSTLLSMIQNAAP
jgi:RND family efflux transporter MFP subunit